MAPRWGDKSPALKILWIWTLGTAAILVTNVVSTRMRDLDKVMREEENAIRSQSPSAAHPVDTVLKDE